MEGLNRIFCGTDAKNTGICDCFFDPKLMIGAILVPKNKVFTEAELLDDVIQDTLETLVMTTKKNRIYVIQGFVAITDSSEEPTNETFGYGTIEPVKEGHYNWIFNYRKGGVNLSNALRTFNGLTGKYSVIFIENQNHLLGTSKKDVNGNDGLAGIPLEVLYTFPWKANSGTNLAAYRTQFNFLPNYINEGIAFKKVSQTKYILQELVGLEDIKLTDAGGVGASQTITAVTDCGSTDLYDLFADEFANEEAWVGYDSAGALVATNTVVKNATKKGWDITFAGVVASVTMAAPSILAAAPVNVSGYESDEITIGSGS
jgi:hypothetical protein